MMKADWCGLPEDVLTLFAKRLPFKDYVAFRGVCKSWRLAATKQKFPTSQQVPLLVLCRVLHDSEETWRFYSLTKNTIHQPLLPFRPHLHWNICCSSLGWMMASGKNADNQNTLCLWHPLTHAQIQLPNQNFDFSTAQFALSSSPSWTLDYAIMVMFNEHSKSDRSYMKRPRNLAFLKPGALEWTKTQLSLPAEDITYYKGRFYVVDCKGGLVVLDVEAPDHIKVENIVSIDSVSLQKELDRKYPPNRFRQEDEYYVVESEGALLLIQRSNLWSNLWVRQYWFQPYPEIVKFFVFEVIIHDKTLVRLKSLGDKSFFFGSSPSFSFKVSGDMACKSNCIYFNMGCLTGVFDMEKEEFESFETKEVHPLITLPWLQQSF